MIEKNPHNLGAIETLFTESKMTLDLSLEDIISNYEWTSKEKARLLAFLGYNDDEHQLKYKDKNISAASYCIEWNSVSGFEALCMNCIDIKRDYLDSQITNEKAIENILDSIIQSSKNDLTKRSFYLNILLENIPEDMLKHFFETSYEARAIWDVFDQSLIIKVIETKDLNLIKKYLKYIPNINPYLSHAVNTGNVEIVKYFLSLDADVNYVHEYPVVGYLTPIKTAISNNDFEMYQYLVTQGADVSLQTIDEDLADKILNSSIKIHRVFGWHGPQKSDFEPQYSKDAYHLKYMRESNPLEYATKLPEKEYVGNHEGNEYTVYFKGDLNSSFKNSCLVNKSNPDESSEVVSRQKIVNDIYDRLSDDQKDNENYTDLLAFSFISKDVDTFKKHAAEIVDYKREVDLDRLIELFIDFKLYDSDFFVTPFLDFSDTINPDFSGALVLLQTYFKKIVKYHDFSKFSINNFSETILKRLSHEDRKSICLMPYCKDLVSCKKLLEYGFDINQTNEDGQTLLFNIFKNLSSENNCIPADLFHYVLENANIEIKDKDGRTALFYALASFNCEKEWINADINKEFKPTFNELATIELILKMKETDVNHSYIHDVINFRYGIKNGLDEETKRRFSLRDYTMCEEMAYQNHKPLFMALLKKGYVIDSNLFIQISDAILNPKFEKMKEENPKKIDIGATLDFIYEQLDSNTNLQKESPQSKYKKLIEFIKNANLSNDIEIAELKRMLSEFNAFISSLQEFHKNDVSQKYDGNRYLEYAKNKYGMDYSVLQNYFVFIFIHIINKFDKLPLLLIEELINICTSFNINSFITDQEMDIEKSAYNRLMSGGFIWVDEEDKFIYDKDFLEPKYFETDGISISFTGGLMQYAILLNNIELTKLLQSKGAGFDFVIDDEDATWDYVNSELIKSHIKHATGKIFHDDLEDDEPVRLLKPKVD